MDSIDAEVSMEEPTPEAETIDITEDWENTRQNNESPILLGSSPEQVTISSPEVYSLSPSPPVSPQPPQIETTTQDPLLGPGSPEENVNDPLLTSCIPVEEDGTDGLFNSADCGDESQFHILDSCLSTDDNGDTFSHPSESDNRTAHPILDFSEPADSDPGDPLLGFPVSAENNFDLEFSSPAENYPDDPVLDSVAGDGSSCPKETDSDPLLDSNQTERDGNTSSDVHHLNDADAAHNDLSMECDGEDNSMSESTCELMTTVEPADPLALESADDAPSPETSNQISEPDTVYDNSSVNIAEEDNVNESPSTEVGGEYSADNASSAVENEDVQYLSEEVQNFVSMEDAAEESDSFAPVITNICSVPNLPDSAPSEELVESSHSSHTTTSGGDIPVPLPPISEPQENDASDTSSSTIDNCSTARSTVTPMPNPDSGASAEQSDPLAVSVPSPSDEPKFSTHIGNSNTNSLSPMGGDLQPASPTSQGDTMPNLSASNLSATYVSDEEKEFYNSMFKDYSEVKYIRLHCTICDTHVGCSANSKAFSHRILRVLVCRRCYLFYGSGEFQTAEEDGSDVFCRWCGQGGNVFCCSTCPNVFCQKCIKLNFGTRELRLVKQKDEWNCFACDLEKLWEKRAVCHALVNYTNELRKKQPKSLASQDESVCCKKLQEEPVKEDKRSAKSQGLKSPLELRIVRENTPKTYPASAATPHLKTWQKEKDNVRSKFMNLTSEEKKKGFVARNTTFPMTSTLVSLAKPSTPVSKTIVSAPAISRMLVSSGSVSRPIASPAAMSRVKTALSSPESRTSALLTSISPTKVPSCTPSRTGASFTTVTPEVWTSIMSARTPSSVASIVTSAPSMTKPPVILKGALLGNAADPKLNVRNPLYRPNVQLSTGNKTVNLSNCKIIGTLVSNNGSNVIVGNRVNNVSSSTGTIFRFNTPTQNTPVVRVTYPVNTALTSGTSKICSVPRPLLTVPSSDNRGLNIQNINKPSSFSGIFTVPSSTGKSTITTGIYKTSINTINKDTAIPSNLGNALLSQKNNSQMAKTSSGIPTRVISASSLKSLQSNFVNGITPATNNRLPLAPNQLYSVDDNQFNNQLARPFVSSNAPAVLNNINSQLSSNSSPPTSSPTAQNEIDIKHEWFRNCLERAFSTDGIVLSQLVSLGKSFHEAELNGSVEDMKKVAGRMHRLLIMAAEKFKDVDRQLGKTFHTWEKEISKQERAYKKLRVVQPEQQKKVTGNQNCYNGKDGTHEGDKSQAEFIEVTPDLLLPEVILDVEKDSSSPFVRTKPQNQSGTPRSSPAKSVSSPSESTSNLTSSETVSGSEVITLDSDDEDIEKSDDDPWSVLVEDDDDYNIWDESQRSTRTLNLQDIIKSSFGRAIKLKSESNISKQAKLKDTSVQVNMRNITRTLASQTESVDDASSGSAAVDIPNNYSSPHKRASSESDEMDNPNNYSSPHKRAWSGSAASFFSPLGLVPVDPTNCNSTSRRTDGKVSDNCNPMKVDENAENIRRRDTRGIKTESKIGVGDKKFIQDGKNRIHKKPVILMNKINESKISMPVNNRRNRIDFTKSKFPVVLVNNVKNFKQTNLTRDGSPNKNSAIHNRSTRLSQRHERNPMSKGSENGIIYKRKRTDSASSRSSSQLNGIECIDITYDNDHELPRKRLRRQEDCYASSADVKKCYIKLEKIDESDLKLKLGKR